MESIKQAISLIGYCLLLGGVGLCLALLVGAVLRWLASSTKRAARMNKLAAIAAAALCAAGLLFVMRGTIAKAFGGTEGSAKEAMVTTIGAVQLLLKLLLLGLGVVSIVALFAVIAVFLEHGLKAVFDAGVQETDSLEKRLNVIGKRFKIILKNPAVTAITTWGLLALFFFLPLLAGNSSTGSLTETWKSGVQEIVTFADSDKKTEADASQMSMSPDIGDSTPAKTQASKGGNEEEAGDRFFRQLLQYISFAVILPGVAFAVFKLLFSILSQAFAGTGKNDILDEYSGAIGVLGVGVAVLWTIQKKSFSHLELSELIFEFLKAFCVVMLLIALIVLTLEIIRLLLDMRQKLIRQEAKYLFTSLIGQASLLLFSMLRALYDAVSSAIGTPDNDALKRAEEGIKRKMTEAMEDQTLQNLQQDAVFSDFEEMVTGEEETEDS